MTKRHASISIAREDIRGTKKVIRVCPIGVKKPESCKCICAKRMRQHLIRAHHVTGKAKLDRLVKESLMAKTVIISFFT